MCVHVRVRVCVGLCRVSVSLCICKKFKGESCVVLLTEDIMCDKFRGL